MTYPPIYPHGASVRIVAGPYEVRCPHCGRPVGDRSASSVGIVRIGPARLTYRCDRGCRRRWLTDDGWYVMWLPDGSTQAAPWHMMEPLED